ncbi:hypothetical protein EVAR_89986_1 [Eumeta japonica]|uniref:Uncharacterized protein n=1 Tax=Eumeta variegata TaxID=151549 RepID=A0A4C2A720_EUMVA|nr:hypothetical protein EVAR_89986_1 [Eumeta japonica]
MSEGPWEVVGLSLSTLSLPIYVADHRRVRTCFRLPKRVTCISHASSLFSASGVVFCQTPQSRPVLFLPTLTKRQAPSGRGKNRTDARPESCAVIGGIGLGRFSLSQGHQVSGLRLSVMGIGEVGCSAAVCPTPSAVGVACAV